MAFFCPICGAPEHLRERRPNGNSKCEEGHPYPSAASLSEPQVFFTSLQHAPDALRKYARPVSDQWIVGKEPGPDFAPIMTGLSQALAMAQNFEGPLAIAVSSHQQAEVLAELFGMMKGPYDQGVRVIPFAASPLAYCAGGTLLFRALLVVPPRDGPISPVQFMGWVDSAFTPYLAPNARKVIL